MPINKGWQSTAQIRKIVEAKSWQPREVDEIGSFRDNKDCDVIAISVLVPLPISAQTSLRRLREVFLEVHLNELGRPIESGHALLIFEPGKVHPTS